MTNKQYLTTINQYLHKFILSCQIRISRTTEKSIITSTDLWNLYLMLKNIKLLNIADIDIDNCNYDDDNSENFLSLFQINSYQKLINLSKWNGLRFSTYNDSNDLGLELDSCGLIGDIECKYCPKQIRTIRLHDNPFKLDINLIINGIKDSMNDKLCALNISNCRLFGELKSLKWFPLKLNTLELHQNDLICNLDKIEAANEQNEFYFVDLAGNKNIYGSNINIQRIFGNNNLKHLNLSENKINGNLDIVDTAVGRSHEREV